MVGAYKAFYIQPKVLISRLLGICGVRCDNAVYRELTGVACPASLFSQVVLMTERKRRTRLSAVQRVEVWRRWKAGQFAA
jgi:hypothetical protein